MTSYSKEAIQKRMRGRHHARDAKTPKGPEKLINLVMTIFTIFAVLLVAGIFYYFKI